MDATHWRTTASAPTTIRIAAAAAAAAVPASAAGIARHRDATAVSAAIAAMASVQWGVCRAEHVKSIVPKRQRHGLPIRGQQHRLHAHGRPMQCSLERGTNWPAV